jgi:glycosyltransferase involved in cell wall biosynthesis
LNVVIVNSELPYPPTSGNRIRTLNLTERLARRHRITFLARRSAGGDREADAAAKALQARGIAVQLVDRPVPKKSGPAFYGRLAANLVSPLPYSIASHVSSAVRAAVNAQAARQPVDLWQAEWHGALEALRDQPDARKLLVAHNVESLIWQRYFETETNPLKRWYIREQWRKFERYERWAFRQFGRVIAVSPEDARLMREQFGGRRVAVVDNGIDRATFEAVQRQGDPRQILFLGSFDWRPNLDAVGVLLDRIFPAVQAAEPSARLRLVGRRPPEALVRRVAETEGVELHADVPDVRPYLAQSGVMVVPLRIGGGSRLKILESLASGLPVVSTGVGAEGLEIEPGRHYIRADEPEAMAKALVACVRDLAPAQAMADAARSWILQRYDWDTLADRMEQVWWECLAEAGSPQKPIPAAPAQSSRTGA